MNFKRWLETTDDEFLQHHKTGWIPASSYERYEEPGGLSWLGPKSKYPVLLSSKEYGPHMVEFRQSGKKNAYVAHDVNGDIKRDARGLVVDMTDEEIRNSGLPTHDQTIVAFVNEEPVGFTSNEFGTIGVWVERPYQKLGIGSDLLVMFMENDPRFLSGKMQIGQMTDAGERMTRAGYRKIMAKHGDKSLMPQKA